MSKNEETRILMTPTEMTYAQVVGSVIAKLREESGMTQTRVSEETGVKQTTLSRIESGDADARLSDLRPIANLFETSATKILGIADNAWAAGVQIDDPNPSEPAEPAEDDDKDDDKGTNEDDDDGEIDLS